MLDKIFFEMNEQKVADWQIRGRVLRENHSNFEWQVPHWTADGRSFLKNHLPRHLDAATLKKSDAVFTRSSDGGPQSDFQLFVSAILNLPEHAAYQTMTIGVDISERLKGEDFFNKVSFPVLSVSEVRVLLRLDRAAWKKALTEKALEEWENYKKFAALLEPLPSPVRKKVLGRIPMTKADLILSYWGSVERFAPADAELLSACDFAVTSEGWKQKVIVAYKKGGVFYFSETSGANNSPFSWERVRVEQWSGTRS